MLRHEIEQNLGFSRKEIRYLENVGIIEVANKTQGKEYEYSKADLQRFYLVRFFKDCGYKVQEIKRILSNHYEENKLIEEGIIRMRCQIKKLNNNIKLAKAMLNNTLINFFNYSSVVDSYLNNYKDTAYSYIFLTNLFGSINIDEYFNQKIYECIDKIIDDYVDYIIDMDEMISDYSYTSTDFSEKAFQIFDFIVKKTGLYSREIVLMLITYISSMDDIFSKKIIDCLKKSELYYFNKNKEKSIEYNIELIEGDLITIINNDTYDENDEREKFIKYFDYCTKILSENTIAKFFEIGSNDSEYLSVLMRKYDVKKEKAKMICNEFLKAFDSYKNNKVK